ncbi:MAG: right-handed parallel beta-helix repeat-containing protein, partial [Planctomycetes bacterium]|nr:right-handed parallel beta-helix repeat-containing protein [Planctomycetota bacterium]
GGIYIGEGASPTIINTEISGCSATGGNGGNGADASIITDEIFGDYEIIAGFGGLWSNAYFAPWEMMGYEGPFKYYTGMGGGVYCAENSSPTFISCTITGNRTQGGISGLGGAALVGSERYPQYVYEIPSFGGGVYCAAYSNVVFRGCTIEGNYASRDLPDDGNYDWSGAGDGPGGHTRDETDNIDPYLGHGGGLAFEDGAIVIFDDYITQRAETTPSVVGSNEADRGGGIYWDGAGPEIYGITVAGNKAYQGAGIYGSQGSVYMERCLITGNTAGDVEIAEVEDPDADPDPDPDPVVEEVVLGRGGGIYLTAIAAEITDTTITSNVASASGGGLFFTDVSDEPSVVKNCLIVNNEAHRDGGGISVNWYAKPIITNCTVVGNKATGDFGELAETGFGGGMYCSYHSTTVVRDSIFWGNFAYSSGDQITLGTGFEFDPRPSTLDIAFSAIQGGVEESGIHKDDGCELIYDTATYMTQDPLFESVGDQLEGNYYLSPSSPYVDAGSGSASGYDMDAGVLTPLMSEPVRVKLSRGYTIDIDNLFDTQAVGLGYHYPMTFTDICGLCDAAPDGGTEHINGDGVINLSDFAELTLKWGMMDCDFLNEWCDGTDVTVDSLVDSDDLFVFTNCWLAKDNQTPEHDPLVWIEEPNSIDAYTENPSSYRIRMSVKPAFDNWTGDEVEYYFCTSENDYYKLDKIPGSDDPNWMGDPSYDEGNWQPSNVFEDVYDGDDPVTEDNFPLRGYVVRARERRSTGIYNITAGKDLFRSTQFGMEKNPPDDGQWLVEYGPDLDGDGEPDSIITDGRPSLQNQNSVKMTAATAVDYDINGVPYTSQTYGSGQPRVLYIFERKRDGISEVKTDPQASPIWEDTGLLANETYEYTVCTIDDPYENLGNESPSVAVLIGEIDNSAPIPDPVITSAYREYQGEFYDFVIAAVATDPEENGVWYQFEISGESQSLQTSEILQNQTAQVGQKTYRVRYWDGVGNYTAWSAPVSVDWVAP